MPKRNKKLLTQCGWGFVGRGYCLFIYLLNKNKEKQVSIQSEQPPNGFFLKSVCVCVLAMMINHPPTKRIYY